MHGYAVTLTVRDIPSCEQWGKMRKAWLRWVREHGAELVHWVVELQRRGAPHIHAGIYFGRALTRDEQLGLVGAWLKSAATLGANSLGQDIRPIAGNGVGWAKYQAKHSARSVHHYQRGEMPPGWTNTGRLWGHSGDWPVREEQYVLSQKALYDVRRLVKAYAISNAKAEKDPYRRKKRVLACKRLLRGKNGGLRGMREWMPEQAQFAILEWAATQAGGMVWTRDEFEEMINPTEKEDEQ